MILPFYDEESSLLYLAGKGDGNIRYYEVSGSIGTWPVENLYQLELAAF